MNPDVPKRSNLGHDYLDQSLLYLSSMEADAVKSAKIYDELCHDELKAGTGFMMTLTDAIQHLKIRGYVENLVPCVDHLSCRSGEIELYPRDIYIDEIIRFENASDPSDQSILYAITCERRQIKGIYVESYGVYHDELSAAMLERIKFCHKNSQLVH